MRRPWLGDRAPAFGGEREASASIRARLAGHHALIDRFTTLLGIAGAAVPADRVIEGADQFDWIAVDEPNARGDGCLWTVDRVASSVGEGSMVVRLVHECLG
jgi:hypothetical protein